MSVEYSCSRLLSDRSVEDHSFSTNQTPLVFFKPLCAYFTTLRDFSPLLIAKALLLQRRCCNDAGKTHHEVRASNEGRCVGRSLSARALSWLIGSPARHSR